MKAKSLLHLAARTLYELGVPFWLSSGTCLGEMSTHIHTHTRKYTHTNTHTHTHTHTHPSSSLLRKESVLSQIF